jgi:glycosyltransferase involved in cell wall biosynthesis
VATVSLTTASLIRQQRLTRRPVSLVTNAPSGVAGQKAADDPDKSLVYMGSFMPYKNVETLLRSMEDLPDYTLHLLSPIDAVRQAQLQTLIPAGAEVIFHNGVADGTYWNLLRSATALVTLSRMEGYGLPIVEAMAAGAPVIASDIPIFREVGGDAVVLVCPDDPQGVAKAVRGLEGPKARSQAAAAGKRQAAAYDWSRSAEQLVALATQVHAGRRRRRGRRPGPRVACRPQP